MMVNGMIIICKVMVESIINQTNCLKDISIRMRNREEES